jgi:hypothetical protein
MSYCSGSDELLFFLGLHVEKHASAELPDGFMARFGQTQPAWVMFSMEQHRNTP